MPGNSKRHGAIRKRSGGNPTAGSGGRRRKGLEGKGPTPKAADRPNHQAYKKKRAAEKRRSPARGRGGRPDVEWVAGRNAAVEALHASLPVTTVYVANKVERDDRLTEVFSVAAAQGLPILEVSRTELDRLTDGAAHQGVALKVPEYDYADPHDLVDRALESGDTALLVALDSVTDPRNLGAVVRSAGAFGAHGVVVPERRAAGMTASAWKTSAGAAARVPVARATNLTRQLSDYRKAGLMVAGLDAGGDLSVAELEVADGPLVLVVGSEGKGLSRLVRESCDVTVRIPMAAHVESLNAGVAAGIALYEIDRHRAPGAPGRTSTR